MENTIIIGSGMAGLTAAIYTARANLEPLLLTGNELGGQIATTTEVENFPGFPEGLQGPELYELLQKQAERFGARIEIDEVTEVTFGDPIHRVKTHSGEYETKSIIIATGASPKKLGIPGEAELLGRGVSYCATCDGFFFRGKNLMVVGGGDSAIQEGLFLTKFANKVDIVHRRDQLRAGAVLQERARQNDKMGYIWNSVLQRIEGDGQVQSVVLEDLRTGETRQQPVDGIFVYVGHYPNTQLFQGKLQMDDQNYLIIDQNMMTSVPGVFAAGEVHDHTYRQAISSAGFGSMAAISTERYLANLEHRLARVETW
ncbi:MAG: thioredoxin-disulfide reductase [Anaerolineae bacterium]|nr:thioredoxin-disulfide reductase [Anaerolineae bacterium]